MTLKITLAQLNATVGDVAGNTALALKAIETAQAGKSDVIVFPELFLSGYPADDLLYRKQFLSDIESAIVKIQNHCTAIYCLIGHPLRENGKLYNAASLLFEKKIVATYKKQCLPNYGVFDEQRYFTAGHEACVVTIKSHPVGIVICEDLWHKHPLSQAVSHGAEIILAPNASPFSIAQHKERTSTLAEHASVPIVYVNLIGGQDDLVFDGGSMVMDAKNQVCAQAPFFKTELLAIEFDKHLTAKPLPLPKKRSLEEKVYQALVLGLKDYVLKNGFQTVLLGLSGGIDSAVSLAIAVDALGAAQVTAVSLPSRYSSDLSYTAAKQQAEALGVHYKVYSIEGAYTAFLHTLSSELSENNPNSEIAKQNCQARCRGVMLMSMANAQNSLLLTTGNRSELAMGYSTLYGDMAGAFCVLKDIPKTLVYKLANFRNHTTEIIPQAVIDRPPSAELAPNQKDEDSLPPYDILDAILEDYINNELDAQAIIAKGHPVALVKKVIKQIHQNEYKRKQAPPGVRINSKAFGRDRRYPITSCYKD